MARLYEYQGKKLLEEGGIRVPNGGVAFSPEEAETIARRIGKPVVLKMQVWLTGRAGFGGIQFAETPEEARARAAELLGRKVKGYVVDRLLVEEKLDIRSEFFAGLVMDDALKCPILIFSSAGGSGVEEIARSHPREIARLPVDVGVGLREFEARNMALKAGQSGSTMIQVADILTRLYHVARKNDARSAEINPLVLDKNGDVTAADCHLVIDDYAVYRHPELGIEIAREFDRPPTELEKIAYKVEEKDYRGTFYFFQMADKIEAGQMFIGFHGAGGGGSMMSMDAVLNKGFKLANYCDTSGNPAASKVYRAAKIILSQPGIRGYFASGSGVASQEQYHSARGLVKAFAEEELEIPAVIRLGGNYEEEAIRILAEHLGTIPAAVEGYGRDDSPEFCAERLAALIRDSGGRAHAVRPFPPPTPPAGAYTFASLTGRLYFDHGKCPSCATKGCVPACSAKILKLEEGLPVLAVTPEEARRGKCTECLACEIFCKYREKDAILIDLPIPGLSEYRDKLRGNEHVDPR